MQVKNNLSPLPHASQPHLPLFGSRIKGSAFLVGSPVMAMHSNVKAMPELAVDTRAEQDFWSQASWVSDNKTMGSKRTLCEGISHLFHKYLVANYNGQNFCQKIFRWLSVPKLPYPLFFLSYKIRETDDLAISFLGIHLEKTFLEKNTCTYMFIAALFMIAKICKQPKYPSTDRWIKKVWYIYTMEYYSAIKRTK